MSITKSELKISAWAETGDRVLSHIEESTRRAYRQEGALDYLKKVRTGVEALLARADTELNEGEIRDGLSALEIIKIIKRNFSRTVGIIDNLALLAEHERHQASGGIAKLQVVLDEIKRSIQAERAKIEAVSKAVQDGTITVEGETTVEGSRNRPRGVRPDKGVARRRKEEG